MTDKRWICLMKIGERLGCHQMPERSFFLNGYQFPVCARCTGAFLSSVISIVVFVKRKIPVLICVVMCGVMFIDWFVQFIEVYQSTNKRRFITGLLGGFGYTTLHLHMYQWMYKKIRKR